MLVFPLKYHVYFIAKSMLKLLNTPFRLIDTRCSKRPCGILKFSIKLCSVRKYGLDKNAFHNEKIYLGKYKK